MEKYRRIILNNFIKHNREETIQGKFPDYVTPLLDCLLDNIGHAIRLGLSEKKEKLIEIAETYIRDCEELCQVLSDEADDNFIIPDNPIDYKIPIGYVFDINKNRIEITDDNLSEDITMNSFVKYSDGTKENLGYEVTSSSRCLKIEKTENKITVSCKDAPISDCCKEKSFIYLTQDKSGKTIIITINEQDDESEEPEDTTPNWELDPDFTICSKSPTDPNQNIGNL